ncbi:uncharacterized protein LOC134539751 isoform X2 [Bacillus rossius redtenbacheri]|uniref:uncharacterized protein LOC134539751 isoform X2 n=1 Tax=Bacillus rossius redtenbacheri TaxID=93214 RepID=UPI002FDF023C
MQTGEASSDESREPESPPATPRELGMIKEEIPTLRAIDRIFKRVPAAAKDYHVRATCAAMEAAMLDIREMEYELEFFAKDHVLCRELAADEDYQARTTCAAMETAMLDIREMEYELEFILEQAPEISPCRGIKQGPCSAASLLEAKSARRYAGC